jgi:bacillithiol biosynthesis cysteine-adding enzyme BshC
MDSKIARIDYKDTGYFSRLILDYLREDPDLKSLYSYSPQQPDFARIIEDRQAFPIDRALLVDQLERQYAGLDLDPQVSTHIRQLGEENTFTVCTAHQPNLFTGYLYFVYKILHIIKLAAHLRQSYPGRNFVPVYYMGSEDNDLEELGTVHVDGKTYRWATTQTGAVGRMKPEGLDSLIEEVTRHLGVNAEAREIVSLLHDAYGTQPDIQSATLHLVNALFGRFGLVVLIADTPAFKKAFVPVMREELFSRTSKPIVEATMERLRTHYAPQATPRDINLFYLEDQLRERIVYRDGRWEVLNTEKSFSAEQLEAELQNHPERFSPNVILRGVLQETILPNVAFIGGGGELAYWLELRDLFAHYGVFYPLLMLRNSLLWSDERATTQLKRVALAPIDLFDDTEELIQQYVRKHTQANLVLKEEYAQIEDLYLALEKKAASIDVTLKASVAAERKKALCSIGKLEHKFLRAEKRKFAWQTALIRKVKSQLFPGGHLQERVDNLLPFYAAYGKQFLDRVYDALDPLNRQFTVVICKKPGSAGS